MTPNQQDTEKFAQLKASFSSLATTLARQKGEDTETNTMLSFLALLKERKAFAASHFADVDTLESYIQKHFDQIGIRSRIRRLLKHGARMRPRSSESRTEENTEEKQRQETGEFLVLVNRNRIEPSKAFREMQAPLSICELIRLGRWYTEEALADKQITEAESETLAKIAEALQQRSEYIAARYEMIIGRPLQFDNERVLEELAARKAPLPALTQWSEDLYLRLTKGSSPTTAGTEAPGGDVSGRRVPRDAHSAAAEGGGPRETEKTRPEESPTGDGEGGSDSGSESTSSSEPDVASCDVAEIYKLAGGVPPADPNPEVLYTFPRRLERGEDIFYDYALFMPVDECGPYGNEETPAAQSLVALQILAGKANAVLEFVRGMGAAGVFGDTYDPAGNLMPVITLLEADIRHCSANIGVATPVEERRRRRDILRDRAGTIRQIARTQMLMRPPGTEDLKTDANNLKNQLATVAFGFTDRRLPQKIENAEDAVRSRVMTFPGVTTIRSADGWPWALSTVTNGYYYERKDAGDYIQWEHITPYLKHIGGKFYDDLTELKRRAQVLADKVTLLDIANTSLVSEFQRLFQGLLNDALLTVADILDEMAQCLPIAPQVRLEGSKRLGLMLVFRQYWHPEAYVQGKLVGYKNLLPDQHEALKRRTFVKTTRETTTTEEFSRAREDDFSRSQKETAELTEETAADFNMTTSASGHFSFVIGNVDSSVTINTGLRYTSKAAQSRIAEASQKGSVKYSEKREVKIRELRETEDVQEISTELHNANKEITANYFYYQLLLQYLVTVELHDICPVLLRTKSVPTKAQIDDHFLARQLHILLHCLPAQLAQDAEEATERVEPLARAVLRARTLRDQRAAELRSFSENGHPTLADDRQAYNEWLAQYQSKERLLVDALTALASVEDEYYTTRARVDRVLSHLRENILHYMQFIWQKSPLTDEDELLQDEMFGLEPLPKVTRGLMRRGYFGREEVFEYTGFSLQCFEAMVDNLVPGSEFASMTEEELRGTTLFQYMARYYPTDQVDELIDRIRSHAFVDDPAGIDGVLSTRRVQVAQDALVVEAMPGQVPLLEGFQMAHRMLNVRKTCLENVHLAARIKDQAWRGETAQDSYAVRRYEGAVPPQREVTEE